MERTENERTRDEKIVKYFGHVSIFVQTDNVSIVTDPWLHKNGAFKASWFQFPDNTEIDFSWVKDLDYVCLSHEHQDHYDINFLKTLNEKTKIVTASFNNKRFIKHLRNNLNNEIIEVNHKDTLLLGDVKYTPIVQVPMGVEDSAMIFDTGEEVIMNFNDMKPSHKDLDWVNDNYDVTYLFKQFSGASWYPLLYDYSKEEMHNLCRDKRLFKYKVIVDVIKKLNPKVYIPCAGPPCFLNEEVFEVNLLEENTFPTQADIYRFFEEEHPEIAKKTAVLMPGDSIPTGADIKEMTEENLKEECFTNKREYLVKYKKRRDDIIDKTLSEIENVNYSLLDKCIKYFYPLMFSAKQLCHNIGGSILLNIFGEIEEKIVVDFGNKLNRNSIRYFDKDNYFYEFTIEGKHLNQVLDKKITWEDLFLSLRFTVKRDPDEYSEHLMAFLKLADPIAYKQYELFHFGDDSSKEEMFVLNHEGKEYLVQKYCPHSRGDLSKGHVCDGNLRCPIHNWKFSLESGECLNNKSKIKVELKK